MDRINGQFWRSPQLLPVKFNAVLDILFTDGTVTEPVGLTELKNWCKIDTSDDDDLLTALITTARQQCEIFTGVSIIPRSITAVLNNSCGGIFIPYGPVKAVTSVTDCNENVLVAGDTYKTSGTRFPQLLEPWEDRLTVVYDAGYKLTTTAGYEVLPQQFKTAILEQTFFLFNNRGEDILTTRSGQPVDVTLSPIAKTILKPLRRI